MDTVQLIQLVCGALAVLWAGFGIALTASNQLNNRRDLVLGFGESDRELTHQEMTMIIHNDFVPLWLGVCAFHFLIFVVTFGLPFGVPRILGESFQGDHGFIDWFQYVSYGISLIALFGLAVFIVSGWNETRVMLEARDRVRAASATKA